MKMYNCVLTKSVFIEADSEEEAMSEAEMYDWRNSESVIVVEEKETQC